MANSQPIEVELGGTDGRASHADADEDDPWQRVSAALNSAGAHAASAVWSLCSAFVALATAAASSSYQAAQPLLQAGQAAAGEAWAQGSGWLAEALAQGSGWLAEALAQLAHKDSAPVLFLFVAALVTLRMCLWLCGGLLFWLPHRLLTVVLLPALAIVVASPRAAEVARVVIDNATAAVLEQPLVQSLGAEVRARLEVHHGRLDKLLEHPNVAHASVLAATAHNASLQASALVLTTASPHLHAARAKLEAGLRHPQVESLLAQPHVAAVLAHEHTPRASGTLATALAVAVAFAALRCCVCWLLCGCVRRRPAAPAAAASAAAAKRARRAAAAKELEASKEASKAAKKSSKKATSRLRGAGEAELRSSLDDVSAPSVVRSALAPTVTVLGGAWAVLRGGARLLSLLLSPLRPPRGAALEQGDDDDEDSDGDGGGDDEDDGGEAAGSSKASAGGKKGKKGGGKSAEAPLRHPRLLATLKGFADGVTSAAFDGSVAAAVSRDRTLRLWPGLHDAGDPQKTALPTPFIANIPVEHGHGTACSLSANGRNVVVATARARRVLAFSATPKLQLRRDFPLPAKDGAKKGAAAAAAVAAAAAHPQPMCAALLAPSGAYIVTVGGGDDTSLKLWSLSGELIATVANKQAIHFGAAVSADSLLVAVAAGSNASASRAVAPRHAQVSVYEVQVAGGGGGGGGGGDSGGDSGGGGGGGRPTGLSLALSVAGHTRSVTAVSFAHDCVHLALAARDGEWSVVRADARARAGRHAKEAARGAAPGGVPFERVALSPFARRLVGATASQLCIVDVNSGAVLETVPTAHGGVTALCYSSDGLRALSGGEDGRLRVWRVEDDAAKAGTL